MADTQRNRSQKPSDSALSRWERWVEDADGEWIIVFDGAAHAEWCEKWAPRCPEGRPQRVRRPLGFRERNIGELELRVALGGDDGGVCEVVVDEQDDEVFVRVLVCLDDDEADEGNEDDEDEVWRPSRGYTDCPVRVWLERPLGERAVIDVDSDEELPLFIPGWLDNVPRPDHGYHEVNRRRKP